MADPFDFIPKRAPLFPARPGFAAFGSQGNGGLPAFTTSEPYQAPSAPERKPSIMDLILPGGEGLSREERKKAQLAGIIPGALSLLAAAGPHGPREFTPNLGQALLGSLMIGRESAGANYERAGARQEQARQQAMFSRLGINEGDSEEEVTKKLEAGFMIAVQNGEEQLATSISEVLKGRGARRNAGRPIVITDAASGQVSLVDPSTYEVRRTLQMTPKKPTSGGQIARLVDTRTGRVTFVDPRDIDPTTGKARVLSTFQGAPKALTETQSKAASFLTFTDVATKRLLDVLPEASRADLFSAVVGSDGMLSQVVRGRLSQRAVEIRNNAMLLADAYLRTTSGANYRPEELEKVAVQFSILENDSAKVVQQKLENMRLLRKMLQTVAGTPTLSEAVDSGQGIGENAGFLNGSDVNGNGGSAPNPDNISVILGED